ncbi:MAG: DUF927 domain-containing protein [Firmicutes bacterium]|nr:DUF927 domain-containing protein [Bacillota bacterium]
MEATVPHGALGGRTPPADLGNLGAPILAGRWPQLGEYLTRMARANGPAIPRTPIVQHTGWVWPAGPGGVVRFAMPGRTITAAPGDPPVALHAPHQPRLEAYASAGDLAGERETVARILAEPAFQRLVWVLGHAAAAPWARLLADAGVIDVTGWAVEVVSAATGTGKTLSLLAAMLPWGRPADLVRPWWGTEYALTAFLAARRDLPVAMQEAQMNQSGRAGRDALGVAQVIHALADGGGKLQGRRDGGLRAAPQLGGVLLLANNQSVVGDVHQPGAAVRVLSCEPLVAPLETSRAIRELRTRLALHHGHGGPAMIQRALADTAGDPQALLAWVREEFERAWGIIEKAFEARLGYWRSTGRRELASQVERAAHLVAAGAMGLVMLLHRGYGMAEPQIGQALRVYLRQAQEIVEGWEADRAPMWLQALRAIGEGVFGQASRIAGMEPRLGEGGERRMPAQDYIGGWVALRDLPGEWAVDHDVLALSPQWVRRTVADALQTQDVRGLVREWVRQRVLIPRLDGGRIVRPERTVRLQRADGERITVAMWVFRPTLPDGRVWLPVPAGHPLGDWGADGGEG